MGSIRLHPIKGVNPHLTYCVRCGESAEIVLLGAHDYKDICRHCGLIMVGGKDYHKPKCAKCGNDNWKREKIDGHEKIYMGLCSNCEEQIKIVRGGGVFFKCKLCGVEGAIRKNEYTDEVRRVAGISAPDPVGVEMEHCSEHLGFTDDPYGDLVFITRREGEVWL